MQGGSGDLSSWAFTSRHQAKGEAWSPTEPAPVPLLSPKHGEYTSQSNIQEMVSIKWM